MEDYSQSPGANSGCRTLANLSKLSRRLGLTRFFRPSRQQAHHHRHHHQYHHANSSGGADRSNYFTAAMESSYWIDANGGALGPSSTLVRNRRLLQSQPLLLTSPDSSAATSSTAELSSPNGSGSQQRAPNPNNIDVPSSSKASSYQGLASLPSNERIIETINRLKYEELQRRKERIAQEHRMNQSAEDVTGSGGGASDETPDTPTRGPGILGRLRAGGNGGSSRSSSKKRSSSKHGTVQVSQTDSPVMQSKGRGNSLSDGGADDASNAGDGKSGHNHHHHHQPSCSSEEELGSINSSGENRLSSLTIGSGGSGGENSGGGDDAGEYNGPFQGIAEALVDCLPSPYDRHALRYKKGDVIHIIKKKPTGLWTGKVNNQIGYFKFINVRLLPTPSTSSEQYEGDVEQKMKIRHHNNPADDEDEDEEIIEGDDDSAGDYAETSNYQECTKHFGDGRGDCTCPQRKTRTDRATSVEAGSRGNSKRLVGAAKNSSWDEDERQTVANVINGYGNADKHPSKRHAGYLNPANDEDAEDDQEEEIDEEEDADDDAEEESADEGDHQQEEEEDEDQVLSQDKPTDNNVKRTSLALNKKRSLGQNKKHGLKKERPRSVDELLQRIGLERYARDLIQHGFEEMDIFKELEEEDLDKIGILDESDRSKILKAVEVVKEWDLDSDRIPGQTYYQYKYYTQRAPKRDSTTSGRAATTNSAAAAAGTVGASSAQNVHGRVISHGSPGLQGGNTGISSPHFYRLHHPRDSGIFVGKVDGEEDGDEPISGADLSCAESHPDAETEEIILSPINLQKTSSSSSGASGGGVQSSGNPGQVAWTHHQNNNAKPGSHLHLNRFVSKGAGSNATSGGAVNAGSGNSCPPPLIQTAQQPTSSASSSGSSSSSSGIATTGDSFWNSVSSSKGSSGGSSGSSAGGGAGQSNLIDQNHSQRTKQTKSRDHQQQPRREGAAPVYNTDSVRNRFLQAKSLFETTNNGAPSQKTGRTNHVYENGGMDEVTETQQHFQHHLHLQRGTAQQGKAQQQGSQQNRFLYCEKSSDSGISVCTNSPPPMRSDYRN